MKPDIFDRQPPCDREAELCLLGSVLLLSSCLGEVAGIVRVDDFYDLELAKVYRHMLAIHESGRPVDPLLLVDSLKSGGEWDGLGGKQTSPTAFLSKIINAVPNAAHARYYAEIVAAKALARRVITDLTGVLSDAYDPAYSPEELVRRVQAIGANLAGRVASGSAPILIRDSAAAVIAELEAQDATTNNRAYWGVSTLDTQVGPIMAGQLCVVAARPGLGKTSLAQQVLVNSALRDRPCLMVSLEMTDRELTTRELCRLSGVDSRIVQEGQTDESDLSRLKGAQASLHDIPYWIWSPAKATLATIRGVVLNAVAKHAVRLVAVDYYTLIDGAQRSREDRREQLVEISRGMKSLAKEAGIPLLLLAQLNRDAEANRGGKQAGEPTLKNLAECSALEQDADKVIFLHLENPREKDRRKIIAAKNRGGPVGSLTLKWDGSRTTFSDLEARDQPNFEPSFDQWNNQ